MKPLLLSAFVFPGAGYFLLKKPLQGSLSALAVIITLAVFIKEALYKLHGRKQLIFKENLEIPSISFGHRKAIFQGLIKENDVIETVTMQYQMDSDFVLVFSN